MDAFLTVRGAMIEEEFTRLIDLYQQAAEGKAGSVQEIFQKSLDFIEHLKNELATGDEEEKKAALLMIKELYKYMKGHTKMMSQRSGLTEEQLKTRSENPANFTPQQWKNMQESKKILAKAGEDLVKLLQIQKTAMKEGKAGTPEAMMSKTSPEKKERKKSRARKSRWMRA